MNVPDDGFLESWPWKMNFRPACISGWCHPRERSVYYTAEGSAESEWAGTTLMPTILPDSSAIMSLFDL